MFLNELFESRYVEPNVTLEQYHQVASLHRLIFPEKVDSGKIDSPQFEKWMEKNFEIRWINDKGGWYRAPKGYICAFNSNEEDFDFNISRVANNNKQTIIKSLLELIKKSQFNVVATYIDNLKDLNWPEFDVIKKSLVLSKPEDDDDDFDPEEIFEERKFRRRSKFAEALLLYSLVTGQPCYIIRGFGPGSDWLISNFGFKPPTEIIPNYPYMHYSISKGNKQKFAERFKSIADANKHNIIKTILSTFRNDADAQQPYRLIYVLRDINTFEKYGVDWPELNIIKKSFDPAQHITESKDAFIYVTNAVAEIILNVSVLLLDTDLGGPNLAWAEENFGVRRDRTQWPPRGQLMTWVMPKEQFPTWKRKLCQIADDNKKVILSNLLRDIKIEWENEWYAEAVDDLISIGLQWPELQIIKKSLGMEAGKITEALKTSSLEESLDNWKDEEWDVRLFWLHRIIIAPPWPVGVAGQFETFLKDNFGISTKIFEPTLIDTNNIEEIFKQFCRDNKKTIITNLLTMLKKNSNSLLMLKILDSGIASINSVLHWPELDLLGKKVTECLALA